MSKTVAQWTGIAVTAIVVFGCDLDVIYAMPLGLLAGTVAAALIDLNDMFRSGSFRPVPVEWQRQPSRSSDR